MKCTIPEISWHNRDPVLSVDIMAECSKTDENFWRLATCGSDSHVLIWHIRVNELGGASVSCVCDLQRHQKAVNVVRFSPSGELLASGDDESIIIIWKRKESSGPSSLPADINSNNEQWMSLKILRGHLEDVYDISWSPDSNMLASGSVDNTVLIWDVLKGRNTNILQDYKGFVQGVSWDPCNQYIISMSTDRYCRLIDVNCVKTIQKIQKAKIPVPSEHHLTGKVVRLFYDDTFKSYFRRLTFSPGGSFIIVPSGILEPQDSTEQLYNTTVIFSRHNLKEPIAILPSLNEPTIAVKCCPIYFKLRENGPIPTILLPYRIIFAVATEKSIIIYDTQQISPIAVISNIHYTRLTDVSWSSDGRILVVSSTDGYCSIVYFEPGELGELFINNENYLKTSIIKQENNILNNIKSAAKSYQGTKDAEYFTEDKNLEIKLSSKNILENDKTSSYYNETKKQNQCEEDSQSSQNFTLKYSENSEININPLEVTPLLVTHTKQPRRVQLITLSSPKRTKK